MGQPNTNNPILLRILAELGEIKNDIREMKLDISVLKDDVAYLKYYVRQQIEVNEKTNLEFVFGKFNEILPAVFSKKLPIKNFWPPKGDSITEIDGCIILDSMKLPEQIAPGFRNNTRHMNPDVQIREFIIIESKTSVNKAKVDMKLRQMVAIQNVLQSLDTIDYKQVSRSFKEMVMNHDLKTAPTSVNLIFASNDIPSEIREYILKINSGITQVEYESLIPRLLQSDRVFPLLINDTSVPQAIKQRIKKIKTQSDILRIINEPSVSRYRNILLTYTTPFSELQPLFETFTRKLGIVQFDTLIFPKFT